MLPSCDAFPVGWGHILRAGSMERGWQANVGTFVKGMTDGEMNGRDMASLMINQTASATSEDLRWGRLWPVLVSIRGSR